MPQHEPYGVVGDLPVGRDLREAGGVDQGNPPVKAALPGLGVSLCS